MIDESRGRGGPTCARQGARRTSPRPVRFYIGSQVERSETGGLWIVHNYAVVDVLGYVLSSYPTRI